MNHRTASAGPRGRVLTTIFVGLLAALLAGLRRRSSLRSPRKNRRPRRNKRPRRSPRRNSRHRRLAQQQAGEQPQLMYSPWMKVCGQGPDTNNKQVCVITKDGRLENGMPVAIVQLFEPEGEAEGFARHASRSACSLQHGTRLLIDQNQPAQSPYKICFPVGCMADYPVTDDMIAKMKKGQNLIVQAINMQGTAISLPLPLERFRQGL